MSFIFLTITLKWPSPGYFTVTVVLWQFTRWLNNNVTLLRLWDRHLEIPLPLWSHQSIALWWVIKWRHIEVTYTHLIFKVCANELNFIDWLSKKYILSCFLGTIKSISMIPFVPLFLSNFVHFFIFNFLFHIIRLSLQNTGKYQKKIFWTFISLHVMTFRKIVFVHKF